MPQGTRFPGVAAEIPVRTEVVLGFHKISVTESSSEVAELPAELPDLTRTLLAGPPLGSVDEATSWLEGGSPLKFLIYSAHQSQ